MLRLAAIFQDNLILQREQPVCLRGESDRAQCVTVTLNDRALCFADVSAGAFSLTLPPQPAMENAVLRLAGSAGDEVLLRGVDFGEVFLAGGQSNMEFSMAQDADAAEVVAGANDPHLRCYDVAKWAFEGEEAEGVKDASRWDCWMRWTPETAGAFSAVAAWCALELRQELGVPVGIVGCNWGGTPASAWLDPEFLRADPELSVLWTRYEEGLKTLDLERYEQTRRSKAAFASDPALKAKINEYIRQAAASGMLAEMRKALDTVGPKSENRPGGLYGTMVKRIAGYSCRGVLWYQGESDDRNPELYRKLFTTLIACWRRDWGAELPFLFVQLAPFGHWGASTGENFPILRAEQEAVSRTVRNTWMVSAMDSGAEDDIHPTHKRKIGHRLALLALGKLYGRGLLCEAPTLSGAELAEGSLALRFDHAGDGLYLSGDALQALELTVSGNPVPFEAAAQGDTLLLRSPELRPGCGAAVSFAQTGWCEVNLHNSADIPAFPFRWQEA